MLIVGIQNSNYQTKVSLYGMKSAELPVSFIVGVSFLTGSIIGNIIFPTSFKREK